MAKEKVAPFKTVKAFLKTKETADKANKLLKAAESFLKKLYGETGGTYGMPDGKLTFTAREENGKDAVAYKGIVESIEAEIRSGAMYQRNKADQIAFLEALKKENTNPQKCSQKIVGDLAESKKKESVPELINTLS